MSRARLVRRLVGPASLGMVFLLAPDLAPAQSTTSVDPRFQPWIGCWRPIDSGTGLEELDGEKQPTRACVVPSTRIAGSVDLVLFHRDSVMSRTAVPQPGTSLPRKLDECEGTESAQWTPDNAHLVLKAELACARGVKRVETGLLSMNEAGQWVQFQHLAVGKNEATTVARFRFEGDNVSPEGLELGTVRSTRALRVATGAGGSIDDVIGTTKMVPASLSEAWLADMGPRFTLDARTLTRMADGGVPTRVIDVMVALANPEKFQLGPAMMNSRGTSAGPAIVALQNGRSNSARSRCQMDDFCYGPGGLGAWGFGYRYGMLDPFGYDYFYNPYRYGLGGWGLNRYSPWGGLGYGGWGPGVYYGGGPVVIIPSNGGGSGDATGPVRGRAVRGGGYTRAVPPSDGSSSRMPPMPSVDRGTGGGAGSGGATGGGSSSGSSSGGGRTAKPRGSGGN